MVFSKAGRFLKSCCSIFVVFTLNTITLHYPFSPNLFQGEPLYEAEPTFSKEEVGKGPKKKINSFPLPLLGVLLLLLI